MNAFLNVIAEYWYINFMFGFFAINYGYTGGNYVRYIFYSGVIKIIYDIKNRNGFIDKFIGCTIGGIALLLTYIPFYFGIIGLIIKTI